VAAYQKKTEGIADIRVIGLDRHRLPEQLRPLFVLAPCPIEIGEVDEGWDENRIEAQRRAIFLLRLGQLPAPQIQESEIEMRLGPSRSG
jgi:hypothetical protein